MAVAACIAGIILRKPVIALLFERGNFTAESTLMVSGVFLGFAPSIVGWSLLEITSRSLFALNQPWLPLGGAAIPVVLNLVVSAVLGANGYTQPQFVGIGASCGSAVGVHRTDGHGPWNAEAVSIRNAVAGEPDDGIDGGGLRSSRPDLLRKLLPSTEVKAGRDLVGRGRQL